MRFVVTARAFRRETGEPTADERDEVIDTETNELFQDCRTIVEVERRYEEFWNDWDPYVEDVVFVSQVRRVEAPVSNLNAAKLSLN
jgi:hypothetical protein